MNNLELKTKKIMSPLYDLGLILILFLSFYNYLWKDLKPFLKDKCSLSIEDNNGIFAISIGINENHPEVLTALEAFSRPTKCGNPGFEIPTFNLDFEIDINPKPDYVIQDKKEIEEIDIENIDSGIIACSEPNKLEVEENEKRLEQEANTTGVYVIVDDPAMPKDGYQSFYRYLMKNIKYPKPNKHCLFEGRVYIQFIVEKDGRLSNFKVVRGIENQLNEAAVQVLKNSPTWKPGKLKGKLIRQKVVIPIRIKLG